MVVQLAVSHGHLNMIVSDLEEYNKVGLANTEWIDEVNSVKELLAAYYDARSRSENYFQWVQTLICNLYSLPPMPT